MKANTTVTAHGAVQTNTGGMSLTGNTTSSAHAGLLHSGEAPATGAMKASAATTSASGGASTHAAAGSALVAKLGGLGALATASAKGSIAVKALAVAGVALAGLVVAAHVSGAAGLQATLSVVPTWTGGQSLMAQLQSGLGGQGSGGVGLHLGL
jgi:hypothetical protein